MFAELEKLRKSADELNHSLNLAGVSSANNLFAITFTQPRTGDGFFVAHVKTSPKLEFDTVFKTSEEALTALAWAKYLMCRVGVMPTSQLSDLDVAFTNWLAHLQWVQNQLLTRRSMGSPAELDLTGAPHAQLPTTPRRAHSRRDPIIAPHLPNQRQGLYAV